MISLSVAAWLGVSSTSLSPVQISPLLLARFVNSWTPLVFPIGKPWSIFFSIFVTLLTVVSIFGLHLSLASLHFQMPTGMVSQMIGAAQVVTVFFLVLRWFPEAPASSLLWLDSALSPNTKVWPILLLSSSGFSLSFESFTYFFPDLRHSSVITWEP